MSQLSLSLRPAICTCMSGLWRTTSGSIVVMRVRGRARELRTRTNRISGPQHLVVEQLPLTAHQTVQEGS